MQRLAFAAATLALSTSPAPALAAPAAWEPAKTRALVVGFTEFQGDKQPTWSKAERRDGAFAAMLRTRGVPAANVVLLQDADATVAAVKSRLLSLLARSRPGELLIVYYGSHGHRDAKRRLVYAAFDGPIKTKWLLDTIEAKFAGRRVLHFADTCYSGALADEASRRTRMAHAVLSSTTATQSSIGEWRFADCLVRGFGGDARVDLAGDGRVDLADLAGYTRRHIAFVAENRPAFWAHRDFGPLVLADVARPRRDKRIGTYVEAEWQGTWYRAEVRDVDGARLHVHYTDFPASDDEWVGPQRVRPPRYRRYPLQAAVELQDEEGAWYPGRILAAEDGLHLGRYDGYGADYDEWFGQQRIRARRK